MPAHVPNDPKITLGHIPDLLAQPLSVTDASSAIKAMYWIQRPQIKKISPLYYILYPIFIIIKCGYFFDWDTFTITNWNCQCVCYKPPVIVSYCKSVPIEKIMTLY